MQVAEIRQMLTEHHIAPATVRELCDRLPVGDIDPYDRAKQLRVHGKALGVDFPAELRAWISGQIENEDAESGKGPRAKSFRKREKADPGGRARRKAQRAAAPGAVMPAQALRKAEVAPAEVAPAADGPAATDAPAAGRLRLTATAARGLVAP